MENLENFDTERPRLTGRQVLRALLRGAASIGGGMRTIGAGQASIARGMATIGEGLSRIDIAPVAEPVDEATTHPVDE